MPSNALDSDHFEYTWDCLQVLLESPEKIFFSKPSICQSSANVLTATDNSLGQSIFCAMFAHIRKRNHSSARYAARHTLESESFVSQSQLATLTRRRDTLVRHSKSHRLDSGTGELELRRLTESQGREISLSPQGSPDGTGQSVQSRSSHSDQAPPQTEFSHSLHGERRF
jgi:ribosomal protein S15P/S13E